MCPFLALNIAPIMLLPALDAPLRMSLTSEPKPKISITQNAINANIFGSTAAS